MHYAVSASGQNSRTPARMISGSLEVEKQREHEAYKDAHARFEPGSLKSPQKLCLAPRPPARFHTGCDENGLLLM